MTLTVVLLLLCLMPILYVAGVISFAEWNRLGNDPRGPTQIGRRRKRRHQLATAATDAAIDAPELEATAIEAAARELVLDYVRAGYAHDEPRLRELATEKQGDRWVAVLRRYRRQGYVRVLERMERSEATLVGLENRAERIRATLFIDAEAIYSWHREDGRPPSAENHEPAILTEVQRGRLIAVQRDSASDKILGYWTLERRGDRWLVLGAFDEDEGRHLLERDVVAVPWADRRLGIDVALDLASGDDPPAGRPLPAPPGVAYGPQAVAVLNDLSVVDARADPAIIERVARDVLDAWAEAVAGDEAPLRALATPEVVDALLARNDDLGTERAVREVRIVELGISAAEMNATPPWVRIGAVLNAYWYRRIIGTDYSERNLPDNERERGTDDPGDPYRPTELYARLTLAMDGDRHSPWRVHGVQVRPRSR